MKPTERPPIEGAEPPERLAKVINPPVKALLRSPLHRLVSEHLMLLTFSGRKTGSTYTVVVGRHEVNGALVVPTGTTGRRWRLNFRGGHRSSSRSRAGAAAAGGSWWRIRRRSRASTNCSWTGSA